MAQEKTRRSPRSPRERSPRHSPIPSHEFNGEAGESTETSSDMHSPDVTHRSLTVPKEGRHGSRSPRHRSPVDIPIQPSPLVNPSTVYLVQSKGSPSSPRHFFQVGSGNNSPISPDSPLGRSLSNSPRLRARDKANENSDHVSPVTDKDKSSEVSSDPKTTDPSETSSDVGAEQSDATPLVEKPNGAMQAAKPEDNNNVKTDIYSEHEQLNQLDPIEAEYLKSCDSLPLLKLNKEDSLSQSDDTLKSPVQQEANPATKPKHKTTPLVSYHLYILMYSNVTMFVKDIRHIPLSVVGIGIS